MDRRQFIQTGVAAGIVAALPALAGLSKPTKRPNLLYIFDDEHRFQSMPGEPYSDSIKAPNLDAFRRANFSMERCISNYPLCCPHRAMLLTGLWPFQNGVTRNWIELGTEFQSIGHAFSNAGYRTAYVGKWHLSGPGHDRAFIPAGPHRQGFQQWHVWGAVDRHMSYSFTYNPDTGEQMQPAGYQSTLMTDQAVKIIQEQKGSETPWMMIVSWHPPHFPEDDAPEDDEAFFADKKVALRPNVKTGISDRGPVRSKEALETFHQGYYAHIRAIDREFGRLLKALDETGQADNTIVIFTSDHGEMAGSHGRMYKNVPFEESVRVPFLVRYPGVTPKGKSSETLFSSIDIYPTLCGLAGIPVPAHCKGRDLSAAMRGQKVMDAEVVFLMNEGGGKAEAAAGAIGAAPMSAAPQAQGGHVSDAPPTARGTDGNGGGFAPPNFRGLRSKTHTYAVAQDGRWLLFDNVKDPYQQNNLIDDPAKKPMIDHFDKLIAHWLQQANDPFEYATAIQRRSAEPA
jgi:arylsulfatase A-like enzyme